MKLLITTFDAILVVHLDPSLQVADVEVVEEGAGIYFGVTRSDETLYVVSRNIDIAGNILRSDRKTNAILECERHSKIAVRNIWSHENFNDLHQIRATPRFLLVLTAIAPCLLVFDRQSRLLLSQIDIAAFVPADLQHPPHPVRVFDVYHFNSLTVANDRLFILAHNWDYGSFAMEYRFQHDLVDADTLALAAIHQGLGHENHDIFADGRNIHVVDSRSNRLLIRGSVRQDIQLPPPNGGAFPRGLAASDQHLFITSGVASTDREGRYTSECRLIILERDTYRVVHDHSIGPYGNACDITFLDQVDYTDRTF